MLRRQQAMIITEFKNSTIESLAKLLGNCGTGSEIDRILQNCGIQDDSEMSTKWKRLDHIFIKTQQQYQCANKIIDFIQKYLDPSRFTDNSETFEEYRLKLNMILAFEGLEYRPDGKFQKIQTARTLVDAEERTNIILAKLNQRRTHPEALKYCRAELMQNDYFHAVFEASKGLAQRIRDMSGAKEDGVNLVQKVFLLQQPILAFNSLNTETERSEHKGFCHLLQGCFSMIRNPRAHVPKMLWEDDNDVADCFTLISFLHRILDDCSKRSI